MSHNFHRSKGAQRQGVLSSIHLAMDKEDWVVCCSDLNSFEVPYRGVDNESMLFTIRQLYKCRNY